MAIEFHCSHCGKLVRAPDETGGKRGKCPSCQQMVYIPMPGDQLEPLEIAPVDETEESERTRLLKETQDLRQRLLRERDAPHAAGDTAKPPPTEQPLPPMLDMQTLLVEYAQAMAAGDLERADELAADIRTDMNAANDVIDRLILDEIPPESLANIPRPVLIGFFKQLREKK